MELLTSIRGQGRRLALCVRSFSEPVDFAISVNSFGSLIFQRNLGWLGGRVRSGVWGGDGRCPQTSRVWRYIALLPASFRGRTLSVATAPYGEHFEDDADVLVVVQNVPLELRAELVDELSQAFEEAVGHGRHP